MNKIIVLFLISLISLNFAFAEVEHKSDSTVEDIVSSTENITTEVSTPTHDCKIEQVSFGYVVLFALGFTLVRLICWALKKRP